ncbi:MAG: cupin domain-containing protein [Candidatus Diapherotrites archaeon]|nr:cupin domain-containing protein [Candidatus Diapherotrites archaeon]
MRLIKSSEGSWVNGEGEFNYRKKVRMDSVPQPVNLVQDVVIPAGGTVKAHAHRQTSEIFYVTRGTLKITVEGKEFGLVPGDIVLVDTGEEHAFANESGTGAGLLVLKINYTKGDSLLG